MKKLVAVLLSIATLGILLPVLVAVLNRNKSELKAIGLKARSLKKTAIRKTQELSDRQNKILDLIKKHGVGEMGVIKSRFLEVSPRTLRRDLTALVEVGLLSKVGDTKGTEYRLKNR